MSVTQVKYKHLAE